MPARKSPKSPKSSARQAQPQSIGKIDLTKQKRGSKYTLEQKAEVVAIAAASRSKREASRITGVGDDTVARWQSEVQVNEELAAVAAQKIDELGIELDGVIHDMVSSIKDQAKSATLKDIFGLCALIDKRELLAGKPTTRSESISKLQPQERKARLLQLVAKASNG